MSFAHLFKTPGPNNNPNGVDQHTGVGVGGKGDGVSPSATMIKPKAGGSKGKASAKKQESWGAPAGHRRLSTVARLFGLK